MIRFALDALGQRSRLACYCVALLSVALVTFLRLPLAPFLGNSVPFILYFPAIVVAGWFGGMGPGFLATAVSGYCAKTWFFEPYGSFEIRDWPSAFRLLVFVLSGGLISFLCGRLHQRTRQLEKEKATLASKVKERTLHLEQAIKDMESFSYSVSHDLRAPLRGIQGFSEVLLEDEGPRLSAEGRNVLERIRGSVARMDQLITDLLAFARVSGSAFEIRAVSLSAAVASVMDISPQLASAVDAKDCTHSVFGNETLVHQILLNLMENAAKFVAPGVAPKICVQSEVRGDRVRLWVSDNGIGIAEANRDKVFQLFERVSPAQYTGTGLGLAIVERAAAKMNGNVGVESQPGQGSRFWVDLPGA